MWILDVTLAAFIGMCFGILIRSKMAERNEKNRKDREDAWNRMLSDLEREVSLKCQEVNLYKSLYTKQMHTRGTVRTPVCRMTIRKSPTAYSRTCDYTKVTKEQLLASSQQHILDVSTGMEWFANLLSIAGEEHDRDKITDIDNFYSDFVTFFMERKWLNNHYQVTRHHLNVAGVARNNVDLIDVIEYIVDCVMSDMARQGSVYPVTISDDVLRSAFINTVERLKNNVRIEGEMAGRS